MSKEEHFNTLKNSDLTFDTTFYNALAKTIDISHIYLIVLT